LFTGKDVPATHLLGPSHAPLLLETSRPGIFCVGDVRSGSIKRVATAIGEGSMAVRLVFDRAQTKALYAQAGAPTSQSSSSS
jgi:thioredoxin reductase (NADPH)